MFVFENMIGLFEDRLFYEGGKLPFVPVPEHLGIFASYYKVARKEGSRVSGFSMRVKAVLNGFINRLLLSEVNNLEEEKNYRETESLHPTLAKMVRLKWKSTSAKRAVSSIY